MGIHNIDITSNNASPKYAVIAHNEVWGSETEVRTSCK